MTINVVVPDTPEWAENLVIYEIPVRSFTSPSGPGSGTFRSAAEKASYLADLGVTGVWLTGHSSADSRHFYNIWTQYACIDPSEIEVEIGTETDFIEMVEAFHENEIKVFLDVITHGVMSDSPLVQRHPDWFHGGSWGMRDFAWHKRIAELDRWWCDVWVNYVTEYGVDGFRLDVATFRPELWASIKYECQQMGHPIVVFSENGPGFKGAHDFVQRDIQLTNQTVGVAWDRDVFSHPATEFQKSVEKETNVSVHYGMERIFYGASLDERVLAIAETQFGEEFVGAMTPQYSISLGDDFVTDMKTIEYKRRFSVHDTYETEWAVAGKIERDYSIDVEINQYGHYARFPARLSKGIRRCIQLSSHDDGWEGFRGSNPYAARGSRFIFGYAFCLLPAIPIFMAGEEFNANYRPLPDLTPDLYGSGEKGAGTWLYGSWIDWDNLNTTDHAQMKNDVRLLISIRRRFPELIVPNIWGCEPSIICLSECHSEWSDDSSDRTVPRPYMYQNKHRTLLIAGNSSRTCDLKITVPNNDLVRSLADSCVSGYTWRNLYGGDGESSGHIDGIRDICDSTEFTIRRDCQPGGGVLVTEIVSMERDGL